MADPSLEVDALRTAATLPPLLVEARQLAGAALQGRHGRRRSGTGEDFWQFRRYQTGDSAQAIDWRQSAKSDAVFLREREWSAAETILLWPDPSASMRWRSAPGLPEKRHRAALLGLAAAVLLLEAGERVCLLGDRPVSGMTALPRLTGTILEQPAVSGMPSGPLSRRGQVLLLSDFLEPPETVFAAVKSIAGSGLKGHLVHVIDPAEETLPGQGRVRYQGLEGEGEVVVARAESLASDYGRRWQAHCDGLRDLARGLGWSYLAHRTDRSPIDALAALHGALSGR
jgi:uncharacterized protein (DUF58 family)